MALTLIDILDESLTSATEKYMCPYSERSTYMYSFYGGLNINEESGELEPAYPAKYTRNSLLNLVVKSVKVEKPGSVFYTATQDNIFLIVEYGAPKPGDEDDSEDPENPDPEDLFEVSIDVAGEHITLPKGNVVWGSGVTYPNIAGDPIGEEESESYKLVPTIECTFSYPKAKKLMVATMSGLVGKVNTGAFKIPHDTSSFAAGKVLFVGSQSKQKKTTAGWQYADRQLKFHIREPGWNYLFSAKVGNWQKIVCKNGDPPFASGSFTPLFVV